MARATLLMHNFLPETNEMAARAVGLGLIRLKKEGERYGGCLAPGPMPNK